jgi:hypothetical protein
MLIFNKLVFVVLFTILTGCSQPSDDFVPIKVDQQINVSAQSMKGHECKLLKI